MPTPLRPRRLVARFEALLKKAVAGDQPLRVAVVGAGASGVEVACALQYRCGGVAQATSFRTMLSPGRLPCKHATLLWMSHTCMPSCFTGALLQATEGAASGRHPKQLDSVSGVTRANLARVDPVRPPRLPAPAQGEWRSTFVGHVLAGVCTWCPCNSSPLCVLLPMQERGIAVYEAAGGVQEVQPAALVLGDGQTVPFDECLWTTQVWPALSRLLHRCLSCWCSADVKLRAATALGCALVQHVLLPPPPPIAGQRRQLAGRNWAACGQGWFPAGQRLPAKRWRAAERVCSRRCGIQYPQPAAQGRHICCARGEWLTAASLLNWVGCRDWSAHAWLGDVLNGHDRSRTRFDCTNLLSPSRALPWRRTWSAC